LEENLGPLTEKQQALVTVLEVIRVEEHIPDFSGLVGCPRKSRSAVARSFVAKAVYNMTTTRALLDRLACDVKLRRICGWERAAQVPSESTFSRAFEEFSRMRLPAVVHEALIERTQKDRLVAHISRDSTEIEAREKPHPKQESTDQKEGKGGAPCKGACSKKGEKTVKEPTRLERQQEMSLDEMLADLPTACDVGVKRNSKGHQEKWVGYKLHVDVADGQIPISCVLTSASLHDSQAAIPLAEMTVQRVVNLYDLMDSAYDAEAIGAHSKRLGHVPIIDVNPRRDAVLRASLAQERVARATLNLQYPEDVRFRERTAVERVFGRLKDEFGGRMLRVRGAPKSLCHLMFGILALTADELMRLII